MLARLDEGGYGVRRDWVKKSLVGRWGIDKVLCFLRMVGWREVY